jgi:hypothetical protein
MLQILIRFLQIFYLNKLNMQGDSEISLEKNPVIGDDEKKS